MGKILPDQKPKKAIDETKERFEAFNEKLISQQIEEAFSEAGFKIINSFNS